MGHSYNWRHEQHTKDFEKELNTPMNKLSQPFRISDGIMIVGKYKGQHYTQIPKHYVEWLLKNYKGLSVGVKNKLNELLSTK